MKFNLFVQTNLRYTSFDRFDCEVLNRNWNVRRNEIIVYSYFHSKHESLFILPAIRAKKNFPNETNKIGPFNSILHSNRVCYRGNTILWRKIKAKEHTAPWDLSWNLVKLDFVLHYETIAPNGDKRKKET